MIPFRPTARLSRYLFRLGYLLCYLGGESLFESGELLLETVKQLPNGDVLKAGQFRFGKSSVQMPFVRISLIIPADAQQPGNVTRFKGWVMDADRLKSGGSVLTEDFFERQLEKIGNPAL